MENIKLDYSNVLNFLTEDEIISYQEKVDKAHNDLHEKTGKGNDFLGWVNLPTDFDKEEYDRIKKSAEYIKNNAEALIVIGIGGSYLGARAAIEMLSHSFYNVVDKQKRNGPVILYAGNSISSTYLADLIEAVDGKDFSVNIISKSGTTTEPAIAFRIFRELLEKKYGKEEARKRIYATTDASKGALKSLSNEEGYESFVISDDVGGRFSVLTAVGLLPIAVAGIDIDKIMEGAKDAQDIYNNPDLMTNQCYMYAACRNALLRKGKNIEMMVNYEPALHFFSEWWKQLYGESEGKDNKGIFPAAADFSTDLHSMGQYIQEGQRTLFETAILVEEPKKDITIEKDGCSILENYHATRTTCHSNQQAFTLHLAQ